MKAPTALAPIAVAAALMAESPAGAAPNLGDKPARWEYAELHVQRSLAARPLPAGPVGGPAPAPAVATLTVRWTTADEEVQAEGWEQMAEKLRAPAPKKEGSPTVHKLRALSRLGTDGWEMAEHTGTDGTTATATGVFKRRVP